MNTPTNSDIVKPQGEHIITCANYMKKNYEQVRYLGEVSVKGCELLRQGIIQKYDLIHSQTTSNFIADNDTFCPVSHGQEFDAELLRTRLLCHKQELQQSGKKILINASQGCVDIENGQDVRAIVQALEMDNLVDVWSPDMPTFNSKNNFYDEFDDKVKFMKLSYNALGDHHRSLIPAKQVICEDSVSGIKRDFGINTPSYPLFLQVANGSAAGNGTYCINKDLDIIDEGLSIGDLIQKAITSEGYDSKRPGGNTILNVLASLMKEKGLSQEQLTVAIESQEVFHGVYSSQFKLKIAKGIHGGHAVGEDGQIKYFSSQAINGEIGIVDNGNQPAIFYGAITDKPMTPDNKSLGNHFAHTYPPHILTQIEELYEKYGKQAHLEGYRGVLGLDLMRGLTYDESCYIPSMHNGKIKRNNDGQPLFYDKQGKEVVLTDADVVVCNECNPRRQGPHPLRSAVAHVNDYPDLATFDFMQKAGLLTSNDLTEDRRTRYNRITLFPGGHDIGYRKIDQNKKLANAVHGPVNEIIEGVKEKLGDLFDAKNSDHIGKLKELRQLLYASYGFAGSPIEGVYQIVSGELVQIVKDYESYGLYQYMKEKDTGILGEETVFIKGFDPQSLKIQQSLVGGGKYDGINIYGSKNLLQQQGDDIGNAVLQTFYVKQINDPQRIIEEFIHTFSK